MAWPTVLTNLLQSTVGLTDVKVVGTLGPAAVAAATTGQRLFFALQAVMMGVSAGTAALVARAVGAGQRGEGARVIASSLKLGLVIALVMTALGLCGAELFASGFGLHGETLALAAIYMRWISTFACMFAIGMVLSSALRAAGDARTPLFIGGLANVANILFLYLLVYGGWGFPKIGIKGAALAGGLAFSATSLLYLWLWRSGRLSLPPSAADERGRERLRAVLRIGTPAALEQIVVQVGLVTFTVIIARGFGTHALAAWGIGAQILSLSFVVGFGFAIAASTLVGQYLGAGDRLHAAQSGWRAMRLAMVSMTLLAAVIVPNARTIARLLIDDPDVVELTAMFIRFLGLAQPLMAIDYSLSGALRGSGDTRFPLLCTISGLLIGRVLLSAIFTWRGLPISWIYATVLADYGTKSTLLVMRFRSNKWQHAFGQSQPPPAPKLEAAANEPVRVSTRR
jgi:putative MATE family efflux protein